MQSGKDDSLQTIPFRMREDVPLIQLKLSQELAMLA